MAAGRAFQIGAAPDHFHHFSGGAAAAIAEAKGEHKRIDIFLLDAVLFPAGQQIACIEIGIVFLIQMAEHPAAIQAFPPEHIIREGLAFGILPHKLLGCKIGNLALFQNLGQRRAETEGIRHPGHFTIHAQLPAVPPLAPYHLANQTFAGGNMGIGFDPHSAFGAELALAHLFFYSIIHIGV